jgi:AraC family transcriptional activator FtrA
MSERTFLRRFRESVGLSPADWLQHERMCRARELLEVTDTPLHAIAEQCGYRSLETFRAAFRRVVGASPSAYRARFRRDR